MSKLILAFYCACLIVIVTSTARFDRHAPTHRPHGHEAEIDNIASKNYWDYLRLRDPATGEIPRGIRSRELAFARTLVPFSGAAIANSTSSIHTNGWNAAGPMNAGGRTQAVGVDLANEQNIVIATAQGGVWRSTDSGNTWKRSTAPDELKDIMSLVQDRRVNKRNIWYCGTGELLSTTDRRISIVGPPRWRTTDIGDGIFKSIDSGKTWSLLPSTHDTTETTLDSVFDGVWNIVTDPVSSQDIVYAAGFGAIMRSTNGGTSWTQVLGDQNHKSFCTDMQITSTGVLYAYLSQYSLDGVTPATAGVWRSADGINWTNITPSIWPQFTQRLKIAIAPSNENILYVAGCDDSAGLNPIMIKYTYGSGNGAGVNGTWEDRSANLSMPVADASGSNTLGGYAVTLSVFPTDPETVFFGGTNLFRSPDGFSNANTVEWVGGYNYDQSSAQSYPNHHPDNHGVAFCPSHPNKMYNVNDGGVYVTEDCRAEDSASYPISWQNLNNGDIASILYVIAIDKYRAGDTTIVGGFQDQGSWYDSAGSNRQWQMIGGGDGCYCTMDSTSVIVSSQFGNAYRFSTLDSNVWWNIRPENIADPQFVTPYMLDPADANQLFFADNSDLWRNSDLSTVPPFTTTSTNWEILNNCSITNGAFITALGMSVLPAHRLYYGSSDGQLFRVDGSDGANPTAVGITGSIFPKNAFISCVSVDPENADHIIVCFSNYHVVSLFASDDGGVNWRNISGNLEQNPDGSGDGPSTRWVSVVHQKGQTLYLVGTSVGLFSTTDISSNVEWSPEGLATIGRTIVENIDVRQSDGFVAIATQGEGVFTAFVTAEQQQSVRTAPAIASLFTLSPNPAHGAVTISLSLDAPHTARLVAVDITGKTSGEIYHGNIGSGLSSYNFDSSRLPSGTYYVELITDEAVETRRLIIQH